MMMVFCKKIRSIFIGLLGLSASLQCLAGDFQQAADNQQYNVFNQAVVERLNIKGATTMLMPKGLFSVTRLNMPKLQACALSFQTYGQFIPSDAPSALLELTTTDKKAFRVLSMGRPSLSWMGLGAVMFKLPCDFSFKKVNHINLVYKHRGKFQRRRLPVSIFQRVWSMTTPSKPIDFDMG